MTMSVAESMLPEFDNEMATTRRLLERVPEDQLGWKPHERSATLGSLAGHLAQLPGLGSRVFSGDSVDIAPPDAPPPTPVKLESRQEILDLFDANVKKAREAIAAADDATMAKTWSLLRAGQTMFAMPRTNAVRTMLMSHSIHHRGQLSVYLRLTGAMVPSIYGPSADEPRV